MRNTAEHGSQAGGGLPTGSGVEVFEAHYAGAPGAGWEIGRPQRHFVELVEAGFFQGSVLDVGCGSGDNALRLAEAGFATTGVDAAPSGVALARRKAEERGLDVRFVVGDVLALQTLGQTFDRVLDAGLFHCFSEQDRPALAASLHAALRPGGRYAMLCFSDEQPGTSGPLRITEDVIRRTFAEGWRIDDLTRTRLDVAFDEDGAHAWRALLTRL